MLNPSSKKKKSKRARKRDMLAFDDEIALGGKHQYEPLELSDGTDDDGSLSISSPSHSQNNHWKGAFFVSTILLLPLLVYYIFDKSGLVIVIDK